MSLPVVTPEGWYMAFWACVWTVSMATLYLVVRLAVRWGVEHGMERFVSKEPK